MMSIGLSKRHESMVGIMMGWCNEELTTQRRFQIISTATKD